MKLKSLISTVSILGLICFFGCAKKADIKKPIEQIQAEVEKMSVKDLEVMANAYAKEILKEKSELNKLAEKMKDLSAKDLFSAKMKTIKDDVSKYSNEVMELTKRYNIYANKFQQLGGDVSKIKLE